MPGAGTYLEAINSDAGRYGGSGVGNGEGVRTEAARWDGQEQSAQVTLPPLGTLWLVPRPE
jgi:1,4-alpha-glucan branching enzyme